MTQRKIQNYFIVHMLNKNGKSNGIQKDGMKPEGKRNKRQNKSENKGRERKVAYTKTFRETTISASLETYERMKL